MAASQEQGRVVVGVDGSEQSKAALRWAARIAETFGARIEAVTAWEIPVDYGWTPAVGQYDVAEGMEQALADTISEVFGQDRPEGLTAIVREGNSARVLLEASEGAVMAVVGSRGHGGFAGLLLGAVSANLAEHAHCPVLVVHGDQVPD